MEQNEEITDINRNIISWYPFKKDSKILEIWGEEESLFSQEEKFDYIVLIGLKNKKYIQKAIENSKRILNDDGILLITIDNKIGINKMCTQSENTNNHLIGRKKLEELLDKNNLKYRN